MKNYTTKITSSYRIDCLYREGQGPLLVFLHGYGQSAQSFFELIEPIVPHDAAVLIPNGPFPLPGKARTIEALGFAWYFYDANSDHYFVPYEIPAGLVSDLIKELKLDNHEKIIVGYSQGGYLAPFVGERVNRLKQVISINSSFRVDMMDANKGQFLVHAINGAMDDIVDPIQAQKKHEQLKDLKRQGDFSLLENTNHRIDGNILNRLKDYLV